LQAHNLKVGDYGIGVPELRPDSVYNLDNKKIVEKFAIGVNTLGVVAQTKNVQGACTNYDIMSTIERFDWYMQNVPGHAVGDLAAGPREDGELRASTRATSSGASCRATRR
jgi:hypothetical protein